MEGTAGDDMGMLSRLGEGEDRGHTSVGVSEHRHPVIAGVSGKRFGEKAAQFGPTAAIVLCGCFADGQPVEQCGEELRLDRANGDPFLIGGFIDVVVGRTGVEEIYPALVRPLAFATQAEYEGRQRQCAVD